MDTENSFFSSKVLLTTGIVILTLLLCVVATELPIGFSRPASPMQQAIRQRQQGRFAEFYPGSQPAPASKSASAGSVVAKASETNASSTALTGLPQAASEPTAWHAEFVPGSIEQSFTPEAATSFDNALHSDAGIKVPVNVTVNNSDLAPQLASLNARLEELTRQLNEKSSAESERVFEYRIEERAATDVASAASSVSASPQVTKERPISSTENASIDPAKSVSGLTAIPVAQALVTQPVPATPVPAAPVVSSPLTPATPAPQVIVVTQPVYPWAMPPVALPPNYGNTQTMNTAPAEPAVVPVRQTDSLPRESFAARSDRHASESRDSNGVMNVFPLNLQMSLNITPPANQESASAPKLADAQPEGVRPADSRPDQTLESRQTVVTSQAPADLPVLAIEHRPEQSAAPVRRPAKVASTNVAAKTSAVTKEQQPSQKDDVAELFKPFEPVEEPAQEVSVTTESGTSKTETATSAPKTQSEAATFVTTEVPDFESVPATEEPVPVLEPIVDSATVQRASASETELPKLFMPEPPNESSEDTKKVQPVAAEKEVPTPQPDPMFLTPSANNTLPPQALLAIPVPEEPSRTPVAESKKPASVVTKPSAVTASPLASTPAAPPTETVVIWESPVPPAPSPKGQKSRSRFSAMRDAFSEAGEEVRERFDSIPRPSFEVPNWVEDLRGGSDSSSESASPSPAPVAPPVHPNSVGPRRFHESQNATGKPGQAMLQGGRANVAYRDSGRPQQGSNVRRAQPSNTQVARSAAPSPSMASGPVRQHPATGAPAMAQNQPRRVMGFNGQTASRPALPVPAMSVPRFDTPDWIEDPPVTLPSPPISQTAHRISSALRFAGQSKNVR